MNKKRISALLLTGIMTFSMGRTVFAAGETTPPVVNNGNNVSITKNFEMSEGLSIPTVVFNFSVTSITNDAPKASIQNIEYNGMDQEAAVDGKIVISKDSAITFEGAFPHAGVYEYNVKEEKGNIEGVTYSTETYRLRVYVKNGEKNLIIDSMTAEKGTETGENLNKVGKMEFTNVYRKDARLEISKKTEGAFADKTKKFDFNIKLYASKTETNQSRKYEGKIGNQTITFSSGDQGQTFQLADGESLVFENLPVGTKYVVEEIGATDGYTPTVNVIENDITTVPNKTVSEEDGITSAKDNTTKNLVGEKTNQVTFTNTYKNIPITGVIMNNLPFIAIIGIALGVLIVLAVIKKQRVVRR